MRLEEIDGSGGRLRSRGGGELVLGKPKENGFEDDATASRKAEYCGALVSAVGVTDELN